MTVTEVRGVGRQKGRTDNAEASDSIGMLPKVKMELVISEEMVSKAVEAIIECSRTGHSAMADLHITGGRGHPHPDRGKEGPLPFSWTCLLNCSNPEPPLP